MCECGAGLTRKSYKVPKHMICGLSKSERSRKHQGRGIGESHSKGRPSSN